ncbi:uncharacterized protein BO95DRAFT_446425 [Aspergillus brunneoviolaceus CBS 621.78]|uniref:Uncharacterized protein n=1 Tax=Aspergillus brunneoviolaceus CBS 621.78 TaxID=1450534 RepID=A0ACD1FYB4_9EURO|nr:hypothetical protein BO95DRAFT_446425 [Aspergillus brunneoviolaceus CBS 621.78]RAH41976.1 hypothetical protein BO95DRAFT_446425 [Aspergillus brunneoviolaceus CBS 621.78]
MSWQRRGGARCALLLPVFLFLRWGPAYRQLEGEGEANAGREAPRQPSLSVRSVLRPEVVSRAWVIALSPNCPKR